MTPDSTNPGLVPEPTLADIWNTDNPRSVINIIPNALRQKFEEAFKARPQYFGLDEKTLWKMLRVEGLGLSPTDNRIRMKFWHEYDLAQHNDKNMNISMVLAGVCSRPYFEAYYALQPSKVAWLLTPPAGYAAVAEEALAFGMEQLRDMLELDHIDEHGKPMVKLMELKAKIVAMLDMRVRGALVQKIEQKTIGLNIHTTPNQITALGAEGAMRQITDRIKELEGRERRAQNMPSPPQMGLDGAPEPDLAPIRVVEAESVE